MKDFRALLVESGESIRIGDAIEAAVRAALVSHELLDHRSRHFAAIDVGAFRVSVQASSTAYCDPRVTTNDLTAYSTWEVWCGPQGDDLCALFDHAAHPARITAEVLAHFGHRDHEPAGHVPTAVVQAYLDALECVDGGGP